VYLCDCGNEKIIRSNHVESGGCQSCGCQRGSLISESKKTHQSVGTREYNIWAGMVQRCTNAKTTCFKNYGGRCITICDQWLKFENFAKDMGLAPSPDHQIDRIDNNDGYYPENCRWVTPKENARNTRSNRVIEWKGKSQPLSAWAEDLNIPISRIHTRVYMGWSHLEALELIPRQSKSTKHKNKLVN
jgi:hypothetical protein